MSDLYNLSDAALLAIVRDTRANPPANWESCRIYDTAQSYQANQILGRRKFWAMVKGL